MKVKAPKTPKGIHCDVVGEKITFWTRLSLGTFDTEQAAKRAKMAGMKWREKALGIPVQSDPFVSKIDNRFQAGLYLGPFSTVAKCERAKRLFLAWRDGSAKAGKKAA